MSLLINAPESSRDAVQASGEHQCAMSGSPESSDAREISWPVCASQLSCAHASSGDVVWQVEIDSSCGTDGAVSMRGWCAGDAGQCL